ncbi:PTS sugar transporter subunit IIB [Aerococcus urinaeequi]|uniref:PTS sugar transporter subunit IIB n=1 Tax=Aerococcus urinaeequi TaxID=51665 RepID=A0AAC8WZJ0_9LACT|nr:PTS sugar transporter subunit IIB [Aerococcus urinaeequi]ALZ87562.1 PTS sugar transporter subunit IIB [Aerococcus urinaeequi]AMB96954.1 PTS sugar transporter subunit IIB [Aerococcus urinaeequi]
MGKLNIVLVCSAGMSTSLLVSKMKKAAEDSGVDVSIEAIASSVAVEQLADTPADVLLLGPQVRFLEKDYKNRFTDIKVDMISPMDYGTMNGEAVLSQALKLAN